MADEIVEVVDVEQQVKQAAEVEVKEAIDGLVEQKQAVVDAAGSKTSSLNTQIETLIAEIADRQNQIAELRVQVAALEGPEVALARETMQQAMMLRATARRKR